MQIDCAKFLLNVGSEGVIVKVADGDFDLLH